MDKLFRYSFQDASGLWYWVHNGSVVKSSLPKYLTDDPDGWESMMVSFARNQEKGGVFRKASGQELLKFHSEASLILRFICYTQGVKGYCKLTVDKQNRDFTSNDWQYALWYSCEIDFGQSIDGDTANQPGEVFFQARLLELGVPALLEANENTPYEIPLYTTWVAAGDPGNVLDPDAKRVRFTDVNLKGLYTWLVPETVDVNGNPTVYVGDGNLDTYVLTTDTIFELGTALSSDFNAVIGLIFFDSIYDFSGRLRINCDVTYTNTGGAAITFSLRLLTFASNDLVTVLNATTIWIDSAPLTAGNSRTVSVDVDWLINVQRDKAYRLDVEYVHSGSINPPEMAVVNGDGEMSLEATFTMPDSYAYGFRYIDLAKKLVTRLTNSLGTAVSTHLSNALLAYYNSKPYNCIVVPGASIRDLDNPVIKTSLNDYSQDQRVMYGSGVGIEGNNVRFEPMAYFYQKSTPIATLEANGPIKKQFALDYIYNRIKIGFEVSTVDEINGLQEFCAEQTYSCGLTSPSVADKELNLLSPYIHGMYSAENARAYLFRTDELASTKDNEVFVIEVSDNTVTVDGVSAYEPRRGNIGGGVVNGFEFPSDIYNLGHSPKTCLMRNLNFIKSYLANNDIITFQTATKNANLEYGPTSLFIKENANIKITSSGATILPTYNHPSILRLFLPFAIEANGIVPFNLVALMETQVAGVYRKYGVFTFTDGTTTVEAFNLDCGITPGTEDAYLIRGLCSPDTDINNFIR